MSEDLSQRYKSTVSLPETAFSMKANLAQTEPERVKWWHENKIHQQMLERRKNAPKFVMPDGPPYANGNIHVGTALNKILKDMIIKYRALSGRRAAFVPGWDCHGLPIELNVTKKLGAKRAETTPAEIRKLCREEAMSWIKTQREQFQRLGVIADWDNPYLTLNPAYEADEVRVLAKILRRGLLYRGEKPVYWDCALKTALAAAEIEYKNHRSPSVYVRFDLTKESLAKLKSQVKLSGKINQVGLVIWTTTPWTLPANHGISLHPEFQYGLYKLGDDAVILAKDLSESFTKETGHALELVGELKGQELERLTAQHPFMPRTSLVILGEHVTLDAGTGCVHTAPGHGADDYVVGLKYGLPVDSPVDPAGRFAPSIPHWGGLSIWEANPKIVEHLRASGHLLGHKELEHQYPYGPRSKKPLIFRATPQWFIRLDDEKLSVRKLALAAAESQIQFVPKWGQQRLLAMVGNSPDWCLSRQRTWGVPVPVFDCAKCHTPLAKPEIMEKIADVMESSGEGIEAFYSRPPAEFTKGHRCAECGHDQFTTGKDILDVWFDSGVCHTAVQRRWSDLGFPADIYIEGSDQHRGWFQTSLISSLAATGELPFKSLLTHGFVTDAQGFKMSKSVGNVVDPAEVIKESGAEILRLWAAHEDFGDDLTISKEMLTRLTDTYRRFRNTFRFMLGNLADFDAKKHSVAPADMPELERWALHRLNELIQRCTEAYERYEFYKVYHALNQFFTLDLSAIYLDIRKDLLYTGRKDGAKRRAAQTVLHELTQTLIGLLAPITSFLAEEAFQFLPSRSATSVFLTDFPKFKSDWNHKELAELYEQLLTVRAEVSRMLEDLRREKIIGAGLDAKVTITAPEATLQLLKAKAELLPEFFIVSQVQLAGPGPLAVQAARADGEKCVRCWRYDQRTNAVAKWPGLCSKCVEALDGA